MERNEKRIRKVKEVIGTLDISSDKMKEQLGLTSEEMEQLECGYPVTDVVLKKFCDTYKVDISELI